ncbi:MAG: HNH endonuclease [Ekhidna sp.]|nr:HNH endonuclease [Ekhidna sp.]
MKTQVQRWRSTARWQKLRWERLTHDRFQCQSCGCVKPNTSELHCDHIKRAEDFPHLFWEWDNLQTLCSTCHNSEKQRQERGKKTWPIDEHGWPIWSA